MAMARVWGMVVVMVAMAKGLAFAQPSREPVLSEFRQIPGEVFVLPTLPEHASTVIRELENTGLFTVKFVGRRSGGMLFSVEPGMEPVARAVAGVHRFVKSANFHFGGSSAFVPFVGTPNDVHIADQWYLDAQVTPTGIPSRSQCTQPPTLFHPASAGVPTAHANVVDAWRYSQGSEGITVAVFDSGIQYDHPEFAGRLFFPDLNYICPTGNRDCTGFPATDNNGHGTAVAGVLGASANNGTTGTVAPAPVPPLPGGPLNDFGGTAGVDPNCKLLSVRISVDNIFGGPLNLYGHAYTLFALEEILDSPVYASVRVINMSYGLPCADTPLFPLTEDEEAAIHDAVINLRNRVTAEGPSPVWVVTIAGNNGGFPNETDSRCPNRWPEVITVGGYDHLDRRFLFNRGCPEQSCTIAQCPFEDGKCCGGPGSGRGNSLDILAPGWALKTTLCYDSSSGCWSCDGVGPDYCQFNTGTSGSAPIVAGTISLMLARAEQLGIGHLMTWQTVYDILTMNSRDEVGDPLEDVQGWDPYHGHGNLDVGACIRNVEDFYVCRADLTASNVSTEWQYGIKDGMVNAADVSYYDAQFALGSIAVCDFTTANITDPEVAGYGVPDGILHPTADRVVYMHFWNASTPACPQ